MTREEAIGHLKNIAIYSIQDGYTDEARQALDMAIKALEEQDVARERYEDLCEYFNNSSRTIELILNDRKEFKAWLERAYWHVLECDKLARKLEALEGKDINVPTNDCISRQAAIDRINKQREHLEPNIFPQDEIGDAAYRICAEFIERLPSAQPEIIRCGQCKYAEVADKEDAQDGYTCQFHRGSIWFSGSYCSWAERRKDGRSN